MLFGINATLVVSHMRTPPTTTSTFSLILVLILILILILILYHRAHPGVLRCMHLHRCPPEPSQGALRCMHLHRCPHEPSQPPLRSIVAAGVAP